MSPDAADASLRVADITPQNPVPLFGRGGRRALSTGVADRLEANVIVLQGQRGMVLVIGLDTLFASREFEAAVLAGLPPAARAQMQQMVFIATHTHNAPVLDPGKPMLGKVDPTYFAAAAASVAALATQALQRPCAPVQVGRGQASCALNARRRRRGLRLSTRPPFITLALNAAPVQDTSVPRQLDLLIARDDAGVPQWALWHWCCHATSAPDELKVSADFPGHVRQMLRQRLGNPALPVVFIPGFCGDIRPDPSVWPVNLRSALGTPLQRPFARATPCNYASLCRALSVAMDTALAGCTAQGRLAPVRIARSGLSLAAIIEGGTGSGMEIVALDAGPFGLLLAGAEVCSPYIAACTALVPKGWLLSGCAGQVFGYLPSDRQIAEGGYESSGFLALFGVAGRFRPQVEAVVLAAMRHAVAAVRPDG